MSGFCSTLVKVFPQSYNALLSGAKLLAKIARNEASQLFSVRLSNLLGVFYSK